MNISYQYLATPLIFVLVILIAIIALFVFNVKKEKKVLYKVLLYGNIIALLIGVAILLIKKEAILFLLPIVLFDVVLGIIIRYD